MRDKTLIAPPLSPIYKIPSHNESIPVKPMEISKPVLAEPKAVCITSMKILLFPPIKNCMQDTTKAISINAIQM
jgi:hypothetical protein